MPEQPFIASDTEHDSESIYNLVSFRMSMVSNKNEKTGQLWLLRKHGMTLTEFRLMALINTHGNATSSKLKNITSLDKGQLSRTIKRLREQGFIQATLETKNLRSPSLELTQSGRDKYQPIFKAVVKQNNLVLDNITEQESATLFKILLKMQPYFERRLLEEESYKKKN